jgi:hypothetical protein
MCVKSVIYKNYTEMHGQQNINKLGENYLMYVPIRNCEFGW